MHPLDPRPLRDAEAIAARDRAWLEQVYAKDDPQLTVRAALTGMILGAILSVSDLYIGLKIGWIFGMSITSSILGFAVFRALGRVAPSTRPFTMLENNTSQTAASAAAYMATAGLVSSVPAMTLLRREGVSDAPDMTAWQLVLFLLGVSTLGVFVAVPLKRSMINAEQLPFPTAIVCAETIRTMHSSGKEALEKARALLLSALGAGAVKFLVECKLGALRRVPEFFSVPGSIRGHPLSAWSLRGNTSLLLYAAGAIIGPRVGASLLLGAIANYVFLGPWLLDHGVLKLAPPEISADTKSWLAFKAAAEAAHALPVQDAAYLFRDLRAKWSVWPGTSLMVSASLVTFAMRWRTIARAFDGLGAALRGRARRDPLAPVEVPPRWFAIGLAASTVACVAMQRAWFGVPIALGALSVALAFVLSIVAARATGETNITPISALGKITQLTFGVLLPGNVSANLMTATVTAGAAGHAADLLTEVKTGWLLGGAPRKQLFAQLLGVVAGALVCVPIYLLLAKPERIGKELAVPSAVAWAAVAKLLKDGASNLPTHALTAAIVGAAIGALLAACEELAPARYKAWVPSATGVGIALVIDGNDSVAIFVGAMVTVLARRFASDLERRLRVPVASGIVAGEGLMGIVVIVLRDVAHVLPR